MAEKKQRGPEALTGAVIDFPVQDDIVTVTTALPVSGHYNLGEGYDSVAVTCTFATDGGRSPVTNPLNATVDQQARKWNCTFYFNPALDEAESVTVKAQLAVNGMPKGTANNVSFTIEPAL
jgi:hypothetical protein